MKHFKLKASALAVAAIVSGYANADAVLAITPTAQATESYQAAVVYTLPAMTYTLGSSVAQDWYLTFTFDNSSVMTTNAAAPVVVTAFAGDVTSATIVHGGANASSNSITYRISSDTGTFAAGDTVTVPAGTKITTSNGNINSTSVNVTAANGLLFISNAVASPIEYVTYADGGSSENIAHFYDNYVLTMAADTDYIDVLPAPASDSRKVFGNLDVSETTTSVIRVATITNNAKIAPDNTNDFATGVGAVALDTFSITLAGDMSDAFEVCIDLDADNACTAGTDSMFAITGTAPNQTATATLNGANLTAGVKNIILEKAVATVFEPITLTLTHALSAAADATRNVMTTHPYSYTNATNNTWPFEYVNGTVLRAPYMISNNRMRITNASGSIVPVITAQHWNDTGAVVDIKAQLSPSGEIGARSGVLSTITGITRGHAEVVLGGAANSLEGSVLYINGATGAPTEMTMLKY